MCRRSAASTVARQSCARGPDRRRGLRRDRGRDRAAPPRDPRHHDPREGPRPRRHLVLQQLPGRRVRRAQPPVLVLLRAAARLVTAVLAAGRDPRLPARRRPRRTGSTAWCGRTRPSPLLVGRGSAAAGALRPRAAPCTRPTRSSSPPASSTSPRDRGSKAPSTFAGHSFHSAEWDHGYPLAGKRVAVIGTGASAVQFVPEIAPKVKRLSVFQRSGNWFLPRKNRRYPAAVKAAIELIPGLQAFRRRFIFEYGESLTLAIRHPSTASGASRERARWRSCARS